MSKRKGDPGYAGDWCVYYRCNRDVKPGQPNTCEAGVDYSIWHGVKFDRRPCFLANGRSRPGAVHCPQLRCPTKEEIRAHDGWVQQRMTQLGVVMVGIADWRREHKGRAHAEVVECPACKGQLSLTIASNGHVHGHCQTEGCVSWME